MKTMLELVNIVPFSPLALLFAFLLDLIAGDPERFPHPVRWMGRLITAAEGRIRKAMPATERGERLGGVLLWVAVVGAVYGVTLGVLYLSYKLSPTLTLVISVYLVWTCLSVKSLGDEAMGVAGALGQGIEEGRERLKRIVGRDTSGLKEEEVLRATVETVAENSSDGVIAPLFFLALGGPALMMAYKAVNTLDSMVGYKNGSYAHFGWFSARADDAANFIPARLTGALIVSASFILGYNWMKSAAILLRDGRKHPSPNSGVPEAAMAGALGLQLGGAASYGGGVSAKPLIGDLLCRFDGAMVASSVKVMRTAAVLMAGAVFFARTAFVFFL